MLRPERKYEWSAGGDATAERAGALAEYDAAGPADECCRMKSGLRRMPPAQQQVLRDRAQVWNRMTPEQREHVRTDVLPRWRQMPPDRKQAIRQTVARAAEYAGVCAESAVE